MGWVLFFFIPVPYTGSWHNLNVSECLSVEKHSGFLQHTKLAILTSEASYAKTKISNKILPPVRLELGISGILV